MCSMGCSYVLNWTLLVCSTGKYLGCSMEINSLHIVVGVNNMGLNAS